MKKLTMVLIAGLLVFNLVACEEEGKAKIGIIQYAQHPALDAAYEGFLAGLKEEGFDEKNVDFDYKNASGDSSNCTTIAEKLVNDGSDLIFAVATQASQAAAKVAVPQDIPVVVTAVTDPKSSGLVKDNEKPQVSVTGTSDLTPVNDQLDLLKQLVPNAKNIAIMYSSAEDNSIFQVKIAEEYAKKIGLTIKKATVADSTQTQQVVESLIGKVDAIYIPTDNLMAEGVSIIAQVANDNQLPVIVGEDALVKKGALATYGIDYYTIGHKAGIQAAKILRGEADPKDMPIEYLNLDECKLVINKTTAAKLGIEIPQALLESAEVIE